MEDFLYLEADEEITSVIDKLKGIEGDSVGLVAPKGSSIAQSLVSLKLLQRKAKQLGKEIALITSDDVGRNLANQVGLTVYADIKSKTPLNVDISQKKIEDEPITIDMSSEEAVKDLSDKTKDEQKISQESAQEVAKHNPDEIEVHRYDDPPEIEKVPEEEIPKPIESSEDLSPTETEFEMLHEPKSNVESTGFRKRSVGQLESLEQKHELEASLPAHVPVGAPEPIMKKRKNNLKPLFITAGVLGGILLIILANLLVSKMTINLSIAAEVFQKSFDVTVEKDRTVVDEQNGIIPGIQIVKEKTLEESVATTGEKDAGEKAKGTLTFKNESGIDEVFASGTTVRSSGGVEFTLDNVITVPKAQLNSAGDKILGQASAAVTAKSSGTEGNLSSTATYSITGKTKISISGATTGGVTKNIKIVASADIDKAKKALNSKGAKDMLDDSDRKNGETIFDDSGVIEVGDISIDKNVGDEADNVVAKAKIKFTVISFKNEDLKAATIKLAEKSITDGKGLIITDEDTITPKLKEAKNNVGQIIVESAISSHIGEKLDLPEMAKSFRLKSVVKIKEKLAQTNGLKLESIDLTPKTAFPMGPILTRNIKINLGYTKQ